MIAPGVGLVNRKFPLPFCSAVLQFLSPWKARSYCLNHGLPRIKVEHLAGGETPSLREDKTLHINGLRKE